MRKSWKSLWAFMLILSLGFSTQGCALFLLGAGGAGGYAISKDELEGMLDANYDKVWKASEEVVRKDGLVKVAFKDRGTIEAEVEGSTVEVHVDQVTPKTVRLRVKARKVKNLFPDMKRAQTIYNKIMRELA